MTCDSFLRDFSLSFWGKTLSNCWEKGKKREVFDVLKKITQRANLSVLEAKCFTREKIVK